MQDADRLCQVATENRQPCNSPARAKSRGMTLLEMMVAMTLLGFITVGAFAMTYQTRMAAEKTHQIIEKEQRRRVIAESLRQEIRSMIPFDTDATKTRFFERDLFAGRAMVRNRVWRFIGRSDLLGFVTTTSLLNGDDSDGLKWVMYYVDNDPSTPEKGLVLMTVDALALVAVESPGLTSTEWQNIPSHELDTLKSEADKAFERFPQFVTDVLEKGGRIIQIDPDVKSISFRYRIKGRLPDVNAERVLDFFLPSTGYPFGGTLPYAVTARLTYSADKNSQRAAESDIEIVAPVANSFTISTQNMIDNPTGFFGEQ